MPNAARIDYAQAELRRGCSPFPFLLSPTSTRSAVPATALARGSVVTSLFGVRAHPAGGGESARQPARLRPAPPRRVRPRHAGSALSGRAHLHAQAPPAPPCSGSGGEGSQHQAPHPASRPQPYTRLRPARGGAPAQLAAPT